MQHKLICSNMSNISEMLLNATQEIKKKEKMKKLRNVEIKNPFNSQNYSK